MAIINSVGNHLSGATGTGAFVGAQSPLLSLPVANNFIDQSTTIVSSGGITNLLASSAKQLVITGTMNQTIALPDVTTLVVGQNYNITDNSSGSMSLQTFTGDVIGTLPGGTAIFQCISNVDNSVNGWIGNSYGGGDGITDIAGDSGSVDGSGGGISITASNNAGSSWSFVATSSTNMVLNSCDNNLNLMTGNGAGNPGSTGTNNVALGAASYPHVTSGTFNVMIGFGSGNSFTSNESSNIIIGVPGVVGDNNTTRIGLTGSSSGKQNQCFIGGIEGTTLSGSGNIVSINGDKLYSKSTTAINAGNIQAGLTTGVGGSFVSCSPASGAGTLSLTCVNNAGGAWTNVISNVATGQSTTWLLPDPILSSTTLVVNASVLPQTITGNTSGAGAPFSTLTNNVNFNTFATAGSLVYGCSNTFTSTFGSSIYNGGVVGGSYNSANLTTITLFAGANVVGSSNQLLYDTNVLDASSVSAGMLGSVQLTNTQIVGGLIAPIAGTWNASGTVQTNMTNASMLSLDNSSADVLGQQISITGDAQNLFTIVNASTYVTTPAAGTPAGPYSALKVLINGTPYFILAATAYT